ncbi:uncharacterized protein LOC114936387 [Nylanderia fulva]|uniref:uncharacterized protein LOC114936387 n=1 Tax=Nylanderia fulva TaxID=613905 RepID=UPI0010FBA8AE|nr:uncharacterized protein LOC114936387 [Nylanderia fulva]XP_029165504.1 uncharacterized protein LOC114936387 [Nylanderia fulva]
MARNRILIVALIALLLHNEILMSTADPLVYQIVRDLIQYNLAGPAAFHETTHWNFDPEAGKQRRIQYEKDNGRYGEYAIAKLGTMDIWKKSREKLKDESSEQSTFQVK